MTINSSELDKSILEIRNRIRISQNELKTKEIGLFICCMEEGEVAQKQLENAFPEELLNLAKATACFGGEFNFEKMNFLQKLIIKKVAHVERSTSKISDVSILDFSKKMI